MAYYVAVHGGAGCHSIEDEKQVKKSDEHRACKRGLEQLHSGNPAHVAVEHSVSELENSEFLNAGFGSNLTAEGTVECDASMMDCSGNFGSVGALAGVKNPICAARALFDYSCVKDHMGRVPPLTLVSSGAYNFASSSGIPTMDPDTMISTRARNEWKSWTERTNVQNKSASGHLRYGESTYMQDTVGCISLDAFGRFGAGVSSGGLLLKLPGRIGEAATFGAGCWAQRFGNGGGVACSVSGTGEAIMRNALARNLSEIISRSPDDHFEEIRRAFIENLRQGWTQDDDPQVGIIILTKDHGTSPPRLLCAFNTPSMAVAYISSHDPSPKSMILRREVSENFSMAGENGFYLTFLPWTD